MLGDWQVLNLNAAINAGETYHVALVLDQPNSEMRGYVNGTLVGTGAVTIPLSSHSGDVAIGGVDNATYFHDGAYSGNTGYEFDGRISDVALYNSVISEADIQSRAGFVTGTIVHELTTDTNYLIWWRRF